MMPAQAVKLKAVLIAVTFIFSGITIADDHDDTLGDGHGKPFGTVFKKAWQEADVSIPEKFSEQDLVQLKVFQMPHYKYFIDTRSINVSASDNVARYTVVIEPPSGIRNVFFEGLRCDKYQYKLYASAIGSEKLKPAQTGWQPVISQGVFSYRNDLYKYFFCDSDIIRGSKPEIVKLLHNPPSNFIDEELE